MTGDTAALVGVAKSAVADMLMDLAEIMKDPRDARILRSAAANLIGVRP